MGRPIRFTAAAATFACAMVALAAPAPAATIKVTTVNDELDAVPNGSCSLREAVDAASDNVATGGCPKGQSSKVDVIQLGAKDYALTRPSTNESFNQNGDLDVVGDGGALTIQGKGAGETEIEAVAGDRVLELEVGHPKTLLQDLTLSGGDATGPGLINGGAITVFEGKLVLKRTTIRGSMARSGGAIAALNDTSVSILNSKVLGNDAELGGGAVQLFQDARGTIKRSTVANNRVLNDDDAATVAGGAIGVRDRLTVIDSSFLDNEVRTTGESEAGAGAIRAQGPLTVKRSLFAGNEAVAEDAGEQGFGGAIVSLNSAGSSSIVNSTFVDNRALGGHGGAIWANGGPVSLAHLTFLGNTASEGSHVFVGSGPESFTLRNSILPGASLLTDLCGGSGTVTSKGFNVASYDDPDCGFLDSDVTGVGNTGLAPAGLAQNGGPTETIALKKSSPAVNLVPKPKCKVAEGKDQRGFKRPAGNKCDAGAFERGAKP